MNTCLLLSERKPGTGYSNDTTKSSLKSCKFIGITYRRMGEESLAGAEMIPAAQNLNLICVMIHKTCIPEVSVHLKGSSLYPSSPFSFTFVMESSYKFLSFKTF